MRILLVRKNGVSIVDDDVVCELLDGQVMFAEILETLFDKTAGFGGGSPPRRIQTEVLSRHRHQRGYAQVWEGKESSQKTQLFVAALPLFSDRPRLADLQRSEDHPQLPG